MASALVNETLNAPKPTKWAESMENLASNYVFLPPYQQGYKEKCMLYRDKRFIHPSPIKKVFKALVVNP
jgi:hypothetical protein